MIVHTLQCHAMRVTGVESYRAPRGMNAVPKASAAPYDATRGNSCIICKSGTTAERVDAQARKPIQARRLQALIRKPNTLAQTSYRLNAEALASGDGPYITAEILLYSLLVITLVAKILKR
jgi:hypothetical protein